MKLCSRCGNEHDEAAFGKDITQEDGLRIWCRVCVSAYYKARSKKARREGYEAPARHVPLWRRPLDDTDLNTLDNELGG